MRKLVVVLLALGCVPDFEDRSEVKDLRLLAINAEPPEILVDVPPALTEAARTGKLPPADVLAASLQSVAAQLQPVVISPLVVDPRGGQREVEYQVLACGNSGSNTPGGPNGNGNPAGGPPGGSNDTVSRQACPSSSLVVASGRAPIRPEDGIASGMAAILKPDLSLLATALAADPLGIEIGLPITVGLVVRQGSYEIVGIKRVIVMPRLSADQIPNQNPVITNLMHRPAKHMPMQAFLPGEPPPEVPLGGKLNILPVPAETEAYKAPAIPRAGGPPIVEVVPKETLRYDFYATRGTFSPTQVSTDRSPLLKNQVMDLESTYEAPAVLMPGQSPDVIIFVVVRDERGGSSYIERTLRLK
jgi:hypothetical protein